MDTSRPCVHTAFVSIEQAHRLVMFDFASVNAWCAEHGGLSSVVVLTTQTDKRAKETLKGMRSRFGPAVEVVYGVDGKNLFARAANGDHVPELNCVDSMSYRHVMERKWRDCHEMMYTPGMIGCWMSHVLEMDKASRRSGCTLVFESDVVLPLAVAASGTNTKKAAATDKRWASMLQDMRVLPREVDAVWLDAKRTPLMESRPFAPYKAYESMHRIRDVFTCNKAILWTPGGARKTARLIRETDATASFQIDIIFGALAYRYGGRHASNDAGRPELLYLAPKVRMLQPTTLDNGSTVQVRLLHVKPALPAQFLFYLVVCLAFLVTLTTAIVFVCLYASKPTGSRRRGTVT